MKKKFKTREKRLGEIEHKTIILLVYYMYLTLKYGQLIIKMLGVCLIFFI